MRYGQRWIHCVVALLCLVVQGPGCARSDIFMMDGAAPTASADYIGVVTTSGGPLVPTVQPASPLECSGLPTVDGIQRPLVESATLVENYIFDNQPVETGATVSVADDTAFPHDDLSRASDFLIEPMAGVALGGEAVGCRVTPAVAECDLEGFSVPSTSLRPGDSLTVTLEMQDGSTRERVWPVGGVRLQQVVEIDGDPARHDLPSMLTPFGDELIFLAGDVWKQLYAFDGSSVRALTELSADSDYRALYTSGMGVRNTTSRLPVVTFADRSEVCVIARQSTSVSKLYCYDGQRLCQVSDTAGPGVSDWDIFDDVAIATTGKFLLWVGNSAALKDKAFVYDGNTVTQLTDINPGNDDFMFHIELGVHGDTVYLVPQGYLMAYDGASLDLLARTGGSDDNWLRPYGNRLYAVIEGYGAAGYDPATGVLDMLSTNNYLYYPSPHRTSFDDFLYLSRAEEPRDLFRFDGAVVHRVTSGMSFDAPLVWSVPSVDQGDALYGVGTGPGFAGKLLSIGDRGIRQASNTSGNDDVSDDIRTRTVVEYAGGLYFSANNRQGARKLYRLKNSRIQQLSNTSGSQAVTDNTVVLVAAHGYLYFSSALPQGGRKLFRLCAPEAGCSL